MPTEIKVPSVGESVSEVEIGEWLKNEGDSVRKDEAVAVIETDKATMEIFAPDDGTLEKVLKSQGERVQVGDVIAHLGAAESSSEASGDRGESAGREAKKTGQPAEKIKGQGATESSEAEPKRQSETVPKGETGEVKEKQVAGPQEESEDAMAGEAEASREAPRIMPAAARLMSESGVGPDAVEPTGPGGRILKEDVQRAIEHDSGGERKKPEETASDAETGEETATGREEEVVRMSLIRRKIAQRLVETQQTMALLTTFNEVDMSAVMELRRQYQENFLQRYQIKLGFMSIFVKAVIEALKEYPVLNAEIRGDKIAYRNYYDIGIAIGGGRGLVVPVLRDADALGFAEIEKAIGGFAQRAKENKLLPDELHGGTFTITNGGVYGSLLSTPLINAPQSGVLGMHAIQSRPVARGGEVVIRPMMYVALTYDHRIVDGREAVQFLAHVKGLIEAPARILLEI